MSLKTALITKQNFTRRLSGKLTEYEKIQRAYEQTGIQRRYLDYIDELMDIAIAGKSKNYLCRYIVDALKAISQTDLAILHSFNEKTKKISIEAMTGGCSDWVGIKYIPLKETLFEKAWNEKKHIKIPNVLNEPLYQWQNLAKKCDLQGLLIMPMAYKGKLLGFICLYTKSRTPILLLNNEFISTFAKAASVAFGNL